jgi:hypothetical protein
MIEVHLLFTLVEWVMLEIELSTLVDWTCVQIYLTTLVDWIWHRSTCPLWWTGYGTDLPDHTGGLDMAQIYLTTLVDRIWHRST